MTIETVIKNCKVVRPDGTLSCGIGIDNGKIVQMARDEYLPEAHHVIDGRGRYVLPGLIDNHTHLAWSPHQKGFTSIVQSETKSFVAGGCTTIIHMLHGKESLLKQASEFTQGYRAAQGFTDIAYSAQVLSLDQVREFRQASEAGISAFKFHMPYRIGQPVVKGLPQMDDGLMYLGFQEIAGLAKEGYNVHARVHCENIEIFSRLKNRFIEQGLEPKSWTEVRPSFIETEAITRTIFLAQISGCPVCIIHLSSKEGANVVSVEKCRGTKLYAETCPQYLTLNTENVDKVLSKVEPPIRHMEDNEALWDAVRHGIIDIIGTDHVQPCSRVQKKDLWTAPTSFPVSEYWLPILLSEGVNKGKISIEKVSEVTSYNPARLFGLLPRKGMIEVGADADLVIIDLAHETVLGEIPQYSKYDFNCWSGWHVKGVSMLTMLRGKVVMEGGKIQNTSGWGEYVPSKSKL